jgi:hypothetical protein
LRTCSFFFFQIEYNCADATCIHSGLLCNGVRNCKFGWDEEQDCTDVGSKFAVLFSSSHVISILIILTGIIVGMMSGRRRRRIIIQDIFLYTRTRI